MANRTERIDFILDAKDQASKAIARTRENIKRELGAIQAESKKLATSAGMSVADRKGLTELRKGSDTGAARAELAKQIRSRRAEMTKIGDEENLIRKAMNEKAAAMERAATAERVRVAAHERLFGAAEQAKVEEKTQQQTRKSRFSAQEQDIRNEMASRIRANRMEAREKLAIAEADKRMGIKPGGRPGGLKGLKGALGEESALGNFAKMARGAGAVAGISIVGQVLKDATGKMVELSDAFHRGEISYGQMFEQVAASVPVYGDIWQAGKNIQEMFTHEERDAREILKVEKMRNAVMDERKASLERIKQIQKSIDDTTRTAAQKRSLDGMKPGARRDRAELGFEQVNARIDLKDQYDKERKAIAEKSAKDEADLVAQVRKTTDVAKQRELNQLIKQLQTDRQNELLKAEENYNGKVKALGEDQLRDRIKLEKEITANAVAAAVDRVKTLAEKAFDWSDRQSQRKREATAGDSAIAAKRARLAGNNQQADRIERAAKLKDEIAQIEQEAADQTRADFGRRDEIKRIAEEKKQRAILMAGLDSQEAQQQQVAGLRFGTGIYTGDTHGMAGVVGQGIAEANAVNAQKQKTPGEDAIIAAIKEGNKLVTTTFDGFKTVLEQVRDHLATITPIPDGSLPGGS
jgi:hypothetical protein